MFSLRIGDFTISHYANGTFWIQRSDGEAMQVTQEKLEKMLSDWYEENF